MLIVSHGLLLRDLEFRVQGRTGLWPVPTAIIIDEAHDLEDKARTHLTKSINPNPQRISGVLARLSGRSSGISRYMPPMIDTANRLREMVRNIMSGHPEWERDRLPLPPHIPKMGVLFGQQAERISTAMTAVADSVRRSDRALQSALHSLEEWAECGRRLGSAEPGIAAMIENGVLKASPADVAQVLSIE